MGDKEVWSGSSPTFLLVLSFIFMLPYFFCSSATIFWRRSGRLRSSGVSVSDTSLSSSKYGRPRPCSCRESGARVPHRGCGAYVFRD